MQVNDNSEKAADRDNKYNEKVKEIRTLRFAVSEG